MFSQAVLLALVQAGLSRDDAYRIVQTTAMRAWDEGCDFRSLLEDDPAVAALDTASLDRAFDLRRSLQQRGIGVRRPRRVGRVTRGDVTFSRRG